MNSSTLKKNNRISASSMRGGMNTSKLSNDKQRSRFNLTRVANSRNRNNKFYNKKQFTLKKTFNIKGGALEDLDVSQSSVNSNLLNNFILDADAYKISMDVQYPALTTQVYSYVVARGRSSDKEKTDEFQHLVVFGLQAFIKKCLLKPITQEDINNAETICKVMSLPFTKENWVYILDNHNGYLPLEIRALPEGTVIPLINGKDNLKMPLATVINTDENCYWLTTFVETALLRAIWYPSTVATQSWEMRNLIANKLHESSKEKEEEQKNMRAALQYKLHDFGARGVSSNESAGLGGMAHLLSFRGTDTITGVLYAKEFYPDPDIIAEIGSIGSSIPATEHSTMTSWCTPSSTLTLSDRRTTYENDDLNTKYDEWIIEIQTTDEIKKAYSNVLIPGYAKKGKKTGTKHINLIDEYLIKQKEKEKDTDNGRLHEVLPYANMLDKFKDSFIIACVCDSYNIYRTVDWILGVVLKEKLEERHQDGNKLFVIRPDSGDPIPVITLLITIITHRFGVDKKTGLFKHGIRMLWGDGITHETVKEICDLFISQKLNTDNIAFGMGGALLQIVNRDTAKFAMKASAICVNGKWETFSKDPIDDSGKTSLSGIVSTKMLKQEEGYKLSCTSHEYAKYTDIENDNKLDSMSVIYSKNKENDLPQIQKFKTFTEVRNELDKNTKGFNELFK